MKLNARRATISSGGIDSMTLSMMVFNSGSAGLMANVIINIIGSR